MSTMQKAPNDPDHAARFEAEWQAARQSIARTIRAVQVAIVAVFAILAMATAAATLALLGWFA